MIYGTVCKDGKILFSWETAIEKNVIENLFYKIDKKQLFDDHLVVLM